MNLVRQLGYFIAVAEECHFGRAAARLHLAQPALSQQIRRLEADLGVELFLRTTRRVELSSAGRAYLSRARSIVTAIESAGDEARRIAAGTLGRLVIGCVGSATYSLLPALARRLSEELPGVEFSFQGEMLVTDQVSALRQGSIDLALLRPPVADDTLTVIPLRSERLVVALPSDHQLAARPQLRLVDLASAELIVHSANRRSAMYDTVRRLFTDAGLTPRVRHEVAETSTLVTLVAGGSGVAVVPEPVQALALHGVTYRRLVDPERSVQLAAAMRAVSREPHLQRTVRVLTDLIASGADEGSAPVSESDLDVRGSKRQPSLPDPRRLGRDG